MGNSKKRTVAQSNNAQLHKKESKIILAIVLVSIVVFATFILILDASITGLVIKDAESGNRISDLFFVLVFLGAFVFLASVVYYAHSLREE